MERYISAPGDSITPLKLLPYIMILVEEGKPVVTCWLLLVSIFLSLGMLWTAKYCYFGPEGAAGLRDVLWKTTTIESEAHTTGLLKTLGSLTTIDNLCVAGFLSFSMVFLGGVAVPQEFLNRICLVLFILGEVFDFSDLCRALGGSPSFYLWNLMWNVWEIMSGDAPQKLSQMWSYQETQKLN